MTVPLLWSQTPHPGYFINSASIDAGGQFVVAGTFFHQYATNSNAEEKASQRMLANTAPSLAEQATRQTSLAEQATRQTSLADQATRQTSLGDQATRQTSLADQATRQTSADQPSQYGTFGTYVFNRIGSLVRKWEYAGWQGVFSVAISADGDTIGSGGWYQGSPNYTGLIAAYRVSTNATLFFYNPPTRCNQIVLDTLGVTLLAAADVGYLSTRSDEAAVFAATPTVISISNAASGDFAQSAGISGDGSTGLIASYQGEVILFQQSAGNVSAIQRLQLGSVVHSAKISADGSWAFVVGNAGLVYAFAVASFLSNPAITWSQAIPGGAKTMYGVTCNSDGGVIAACGNLSATGVVAVWNNLGTGADLQWQASTANPPNAVDLSPSLAVAVADGYGAAGAFAALSASGETQWNQATTEMNWPIKFSGDGQYLVGGSDDGAVYLFAAGG
jgi:WD40 repeat protein